MTTSFGNRLVDESNKQRRKKQQHLPKWIKVQVVSSIIISKVESIRSVFFSNANSFKISATWRPFFPFNFSLRMSLKTGPNCAVTGKTGEPTWKRQRKLKDNCPSQKYLKAIPFEELVILAVCDSKGRIKHSNFAINATKLERRSCQLKSN